MYGAIIGDIVGSKYEFHNIKTKDFPFISEGCEYTDDTIMTVAVAKALLRSREEKTPFKPILVREMQSLAKKYPYGGYGVMFTSWLRAADPRPYNSFGNGSAMRVSPCGLIAVTLREDDELIGVALLFFARPLLSFFTDNEAAIEVGIQQIRVEALFYCVLAFSHCIAAIMRGAGKPLVPMFVMLGAWCVLRVAYISIAVPLIGKSWVIFSAYPLTWTTSSIIFLIFYLKSDWIHGFDKKAALPKKA